MRRFRPSDLASILEIELASFPEQPYWAELFLACYLAFPALFLVVTEDGGEGRVVGYVIGAVDGEIGRIISIAVDPSHRRSGLARELCTELLRRLEETAVERVHLETRVGNRPAIRLWHQLGFHETGTIPDYYGDADGLTMVKELTAPE